MEKKYRLTKLRINNVDLSCWSERLIIKRRGGITRSVKARRTSGYEISLSAAFLDSEAEAPIFALLGQVCSVQGAYVIGSQEEEQVVRQFSSKCLFTEFTPIYGETVGGCVLGLAVCA